LVDQAPKTNEAAPKSVDTLFEERAAESDNETFAQIRRGIFLRAVFLSVLLLVLLYLFSPDSRVKAVAVQGNNYLTGPYIESLSGVSVNDLLFMQFPDVIAGKIKKDPMLSCLYIQTKAMLSS
jgi:cell division septal protein FtsQ